MRNGFLYRGKDCAYPTERLWSDTIDGDFWSVDIADVDGDGNKDLLVGQFNKGKIRVYRNVGGGKLTKGEWLKAGRTVAEIPGVW